MAASHRSLIQDQISDVTECSICAEIFTNPKILPCVHTFCLHCLETYGKEKNPSEQMVCPICRREFFIPKGGFSELPSNFFIGKMVEIGKLAMTPMSKTLCALCPEEDEVLAQLFCVDCEQNLCSRCGNGHKKSRSSQHHQVIELGCQARAQDLNFRNSYCGHHPEELIKMYCYEDKVAICLICCVESHQSHRCVNANTAAKEFTEQLKCSSGRVASRTAECDELGEKLDKFKKEFQAKVLKTEEGIQEAANKTIKLIQQHTEQLVQRLKSVTERNLKAFETTKQNVDRFRVMIDSYSRYSEKLLMQGSPVDICRAVDQMLTRAQELETLPANCNGDRFCCDTITFNFLDIESQLTPGMINAIGELIVTPSSDWLVQFGVQAADGLTSEESVITKYAENVEKKHISIQKKEPPASFNRMIFVSQIPKELKRDYLAMIFESKRFGGGKTENIDYDPEQGTAVVTFEHARVAASFIEKQSVDYKGRRMLITKPEILAGIDSDDHAASAKEPLKRKLTVPGSFNTVKVSGLPHGASTEMISMYFENNERSGGGRLIVIENQKEKGKAVINFYDSKEALEVCKRVHFMSGATLKISALEMPLDDVKSCAIEVKGLGDSASEDILWLYFENTRASGGSQVEEVFLKKETRTAVVVFSEASVVERVVKKQPLMLHGIKLEVNVMEAAPPPPLLLNNVDTKRILAKRLPSSATKASLEKYLNPAAKAMMIGWTQDVNKRTSALLEFSSEPDYLSTRRLVCSKPFLGKMISIRRVQQTSSILVSGIPPKITAEFVAMYFENPRNGGSGDDCKVEMLPDSCSAIVKLHRPDVIQAITSKQHRFEMTVVKVEPYYEF